MYDNSLQSCQCFTYIFKNISIEALFLEAQTNGSMEPLSYKLERMKKGACKNVADQKDSKFCTKHQSQELISGPWRLVFQLGIDFNTRGLEMN